MDDFSSSGGIWLFAILALMWGGGFGGSGGNGFANAIGYQNLATQNDVQRGFDNQNSMANQREILGAVTNGTAQSVAATNQVFHDLVGYVGDKYAELNRDILTVGAGVQQAIANQNDCCCSTKMLIQEVASQNRYDNAMNTQKILDVLSQNKIEELQGKIQQLELAQSLNGVVRYPNSLTYNAGQSPFCNCGCGCGQFA
jgi:hypothetical protein